MNKEVSIVKVDKRLYRKIAQENWGLSDEQMKGMHVHHRLARCDGGTNDASNLYVCSPWFHKNVWHAEDGFNSLIPHAAEGGAKGGKAPTGSMSYVRKYGIFGLDPESKKEAEIKGGLTTFNLKTGCHAPEHKGVGAKVTNSTLWQDPEHPELGVLQAGPLASRQKARGLPHGKQNRVRVGQISQGKTT